MRRIIEVPVGDLMSAPALTVKPETPIDELTRLFTEYEFECRECKKIFMLFMRVIERKTATVRCPGCESTDVEPLMQAFFAKTGKKS